MLVPGFDESRAYRINLVHQMVAGPLARLAGLGEAQHVGGLGLGLAPHLVHEPEAGVLVDGELVPGEVGVAAGGGEDARAEHLDLAQREHGLGPRHQQRHVAARRVLGDALHQDGVALLLLAGQPVAQRVVLVRRGVSDPNFHILDGEVITAPRGYTDVFHSLNMIKYYHGGEDKISISIKIFSVVKP